MKLEELLKEIAAYKYTPYKTTMEMMLGGGRSYGKTAAQAAEATQNALLDYANKSCYPYEPSFLPWSNVDPCIRLDPIEPLYFRIDPAADHDKLNIQVKRKHNKLKFNFNN